MLEVVKFGHDRIRIAKILVANCTILTLEQAGNYLCKVVTESKLEMLRNCLSLWRVTLVWHGAERSETGIESRRGPAEPSRRLVARSLVASRGAQ